MLQLKDVLLVVVFVHLQARLLRCQSSFRRFLLADEGRSGGRLGDANAGKSRFLQERNTT
jgi:hypothetical protein